LYIETTSPGRYAEPEAMFSAIGAYATTATFGLSAATARMVAATAAAPAMSDFISHMPAAGLIDTPPVSHVMPLPISATRARPPAPGRLVAHPARRGGRGGARADREDPAVAALGQRLLVEHLHGEPGFAGRLGHRVGKLRRAQIVRGRVDPIPGTGDRGGHG